MTHSIWESTITRIGGDAAELFEAGIFILFAEPVPDALADVSLVHRGPATAFNPIAPGDQLWIGQTPMTIIEVGSRANENFAQLGHIVVYLNIGSQDILPGAVKATAPTPPTPQAGDPITIIRTNGA